MKGVLCRFFLFFILLGLLFISACEKSDSVSLQIEHLLSGFGLSTNIFKAAPNEQLGTLIFYHSKRVVERISYKLKYYGPSKIIVQVQGQLATDLIENEVLLSKSSIKVQEGVVYLLGEIAEGVYENIRARFTIDDVFYWEGKEMIILGGTEAVGVLELIKAKIKEYFFAPPQKISRISVASYDEAKTITKDILYTFYDDLRMLFVTNLLCTNPLDTPEKFLKTSEDFYRFPSEGVRRVSLLAAHIWVVSFDTVSRCLTFFSGMERFPESIVIRRATKLLTDVGYLTFYMVSDAVRLDRAQGIGHLNPLTGGEMGDTVLHPWMAFYVVPVILKSTTSIIEHFREGITDMVVGYVSDNFEVIGELLNLIHKNIVGDFFVFLNEKISNTIKMTSLIFKTIIRFSGYGLTAVLSGGDVVEFKYVAAEAQDDSLRVWKEFLKFIGME